MGLRTYLRHDDGFSFPELLAVLLLLGALALMAILHYNVDAATKRNADIANVRTINLMLAMYKARNGTCPADVPAFKAFLADPAYFPDGVPLDPWPNPPESKPYERTYSSALCRVQMSVPGPPPVNHETGRGH